MRTLLSSGNSVTFTAPRALLSGGGVLIGSLFVVSSVDVASGSQADGDVVGVHRLAKTSAQAWVDGDPIYWDDTNHVCDNGGSGTLIGTAVGAAANPSSTGTVRLNGGYYPALGESVIRSVDVTITSAQLLALNATARQVIAAPGASKAIIPIGIVAYKAAGTAYAGIAGGEDLSFKYTNSSGAEVAQMETTGFLDQTTAQTRYGYPNTTNVTPVANAALVVHMLSGEITTGDSDLKFRIYYRVVPTVL
jgi:predicted RecA/RadA family phage recombinase